MGVVGLFCLSCLEPLALDPACVANNLWAIGGFSGVVESAPQVISFETGIAFNVLPTRSFYEPGVAGILRLVSF